MHTRSDIRHYPIPAAMDDDLWDMERHGGPVTHVRELIRARRSAAIEHNRALLRRMYK